MQTLNVIKCLVISPQDVQAEREGVAQTIERWNGQIGKSLGALIQTVRWETHAAPELGSEPQTLLNKQIVRQCDCAVAVFWSRLGTPTSKADSGSLEEIEDVLSNDGHVMVYVCNRDIPKSILDVEQLARLKTALDDLRTRGLVFEFCELSELQMLLMGHLTHMANTLLERASSDLKDNPAERDTGTGADSPDIKIKTGWGVAPTGPDPRSLLWAEIQNHTRGPLFLESIYVETSDGRSLIPLNDAFFRPIEGRTKLEPGANVKFFFDFAQLLEKAKKKKGAHLRRVVVTDQIDRKFYSLDEDMEVAIWNFMKWTEKKK